MSFLFNLFRCYWNISKSLLFAEDLFTGWNFLYYTEYTRRSSILHLTPFYSTIRNQLSGNFSVEKWTNASNLISHFIAHEFLHAKKYSFQRTVWRNKFQICNQLTSCSNLFSGNSTNIIDFAATYASPEQLITSSVYVWEKEAATHKIIIFGRYEVKRKLCLRT